MAFTRELYWPKVNLPEISNSQALNLHHLQETTGRLTDIQWRSEGRKKRRQEWMTRGENNEQDRGDVVSDRVTAERKLEKNDRNRDGKLWKWIEKVIKLKGGGRKTEHRSVSAGFFPLLHPSTSCFKQESLKSSFLLPLSSINNLICGYMMLLSNLSACSHCGEEAYKVRPSPRGKWPTSIGDGSNHMVHLLHWFKGR